MFGSVELIRTTPNQAKPRGNSSTIKIEMAGLDRVRNVYCCAVPKSSNYLLTTRSFRPTGTPQSVYESNFVISLPFEQDVVQLLVQSPCGVAMDGLRHLAATGS